MTPEERKAKLKEMNEEERTKFVEDAVDSAFDAAEAKRVRDEEDASDPIKQVVRGCLG